MEAYLASGTIAAHARDDEALGDGRSRLLYASSTRYHCRLTAASGQPGCCWGWPDDGQPIAEVDRSRSACRMNLGAPGADQRRVHSPAERASRACAGRRRLTLAIGRRWRWVELQSLPASTSPASRRAAPGRMAGLAARRGAPLCAGDFERPVAPASHPAEHAAAGLAHAAATPDRADPRTRLEVRYRFDAGIDAATRQPSCATSISTCSVAAADAQPASACFSTMRGRCRRRRPRAALIQWSRSMSAACTVGQRLAGLRGDDARRCALRVLQDLTCAWIAMSVAWHTRRHRRLADREAGVGRALRRRAHFGRRQVDVRAGAQPHQPVPPAWRRRAPEADHESWMASLIRQWPPGRRSAS